MSSSRPQSASGRTTTYTENLSGKLPDRAAVSPALEREQLRGSAWDDSEVIRKLLIQSIKNSGASRETIADLMSDLLDRKVTAAMLNAFTAESRDDRRWPAEFDRAFCKATGDNTLIRRRAEMAGLRVIGPADQDLMDLGRNILLREQAEARIAALRVRLQGVDL